MFDVIILGGSYSGMAAALQLARGRRSVLVIDAGVRRNRFASASHGLLGQDGKTPDEIASNAKAQLLEYPSVTWRDGTAIRSEEHTSELQSRENIVCRLLREKKKESETLARLPVQTARKAGTTSNHHGPHALGATRATTAPTSTTHPATGRESTKPVTVRIED